MNELLASKQFGRSAPSFNTFANIAYLYIGAFLFIFSPLLFLIIIGFTSPFFSKSARVLFGPLILLVAITFYSTLKPFSDLAEYLNVYHQINNGEIDVFGYTRFGYGIEFFTLVIMKAVGTLTGGSDQALLLAIYTIILTYLYLICSSIKNKYNLFLFCSVFLSLGLLESLSYFLRQNLSVILFMYGLLCVKDRRIKWLYFALSVFSHISGIINIFVYLFASIYKRKINNMQRIVKLIFIISVLAFGLILFMQFIPAGQALLDKTIYVINNKQYSRLPAPYIFITTLNVLLLFLFLKKYKENNIVLYYLFLKEVVLFYFTLPFPAVPNRLGMLIFSYAAIFLYSNFDKTVTRKKFINIIIFVSVNFLSFSYAMYNVTLKNNSYSFYDNQPFTYNIYNVADHIYDCFINGVIYIDNGNG